MMKIYPPCMPPLQGDEEINLEPGETIAGRIKLNPQKNKKKYRNRIKNCNSKQTIN